MKTLELKQMGLSPLSGLEIQKISGGGFDPVSFVRDYILGKIIDGVYHAFLRQVAYDKTHKNTSYNWNGNISWR